MRLRRQVPISLSAGGLAFLVATSAVNLSNFGFHLVVSRILGPASYGAISALIALTPVLSVPLGAVQAAITQAVVRQQRGDLALRKPLLWVGGCGAATVALAVAAAPLLDSYFRLHSGVPVAWLGLWVGAGVVGLLPMGVLIARLRLRYVALAQILGALLRLSLGAGLAEAHFGVSGAMAATAIGQVVITALLLLPVLVEIRRDAPALIGLRLREAVFAILALGGMWSLAGIDTALGRHFLPSAQAGTYAAASTASRIAMFLPGAITIVAFPRFASAAHEHRDDRRLLVEVLLLTALLGGLAAAVILVVPGVVISVLFGSAFGASSGLVGLLSIEGACLAVIGTLVYYLLARHSVLPAIATWIVAGAAAVAISLVHRRPIDIAAVVTLLAAGLLAALLVPAWRISRPRPARGDLAPVDLESAAELELTLVVPFYNPGPALRPHLEAVLDALRTSAVSFEVLAVSDGSTDGSNHCLDDLVGEELRVVSLPRNAGKGAALRAGLRAGRGEYLGFIDGDGDLGADLLDSFVRCVRSQHPDIVLGSKRHPDSKVHYPPLRRLYSAGFQALVWVLFRLSIKDTQTGVKLVRRETLASVLPMIREKGFAFDLELFVIARKQGYTSFAELPVVIEERFTSTISARTVVRMLADTLRIFVRRYVLESYERAAPVADSTETVLPEGAEAPAAHHLDSVPLRPGVGRPLIEVMVAPTIYTSIDGDGVIDAGVEHESGGDTGSRRVAR